MLGTDSRAKAERAAQMIQDPRVEYFHDPERRSGRAVARSLGAEGPIAWDIYLFYPPDVRWEKELPRPADWVHQLWGRDWADADRYRHGMALRNALREMAAGFLGPSAADASG